MPTSNKISYYDQEELLAEAIQYKIDNPEASFRFLEQQFKVKKDKICRRFHGKQESYSGRTPTNTRLTQEQDKALCWFLDYLHKFGVPLRYKDLTSAANHILTISDPDAKPVSIRICREGALYRSHGSGRLLTQSTIVVFWPSWYRPAF